MHYLVTKEQWTVKQLQLFIAAVLSLGVLLLGNRGSVGIAACSMPTDKGTVAMTVNVDTSGSYRVWTRMYVPSSSNNSYLLQIDEELCNVTVGNAAITPNTWIWVDWRDGDTDSKINVNLSAGQHTVKLAGSEGEVRVDTVLLLADTSCIPTGTSGTNCAGASSSGSTDDATPASSGSGSSSGQTVPSGVDQDPIVKNVSDIPNAAISAIANPTSIPRVIRGPYGWLTGLVLLLLLAIIASTIWLKRYWFKEQSHSLQQLLFPSHRYTTQPHPESILHTVVVHPTKKDPGD